MTTTLEIDPLTPPAAVRGEVEIDPAQSADASNAPPSRRPVGMPFSVPRSQLYYWTKVWQDGVRVAHEALERGDFVDFDSEDPNDVVRWLFEVDEDE